MAHSVLVIDDDEVMRSLITDILEPFGFTVRTAGTADEGLKSATESRPDVILCDLILPDALGSETAQAFKSLPQTRTVPVILVTGYSYLKGYLRDTNCKIVAKPFSMSKMLETVQEAVGAPATTPDAALPSAAPVVVAEK
jgi:CheY-like chemotaxis protein